MKHLSVILAILIVMFSVVSPALASPSVPVGSITPAYVISRTGQPVTLSVHIDMSGVPAPDNKLGSYTGTLDWNPAVLTYVGNSGPLDGFTGVVNATNAASGHLIFNGIKVAGATGNTTVLTVSFISSRPGFSVANLSFRTMGSAVSFKNLLPGLIVHDGWVTVRR